MRRAVAIAALALLVLGACGDDDSTGSASGSGSGSGAGGETEAPVTLSGEVNDHGIEDAAGKDELAVELDDFYFGPTYIKVTSGQKLTLELENEGEATHTFTSDTLGVDETVEPGKTTTVEVTLTDAEAVAFHCRFHEGSGMQGAFYTKEGATPAAPTEPSEPTVTSGASGASGY